MIKIASKVLFLSFLLFNQPVFADQSLDLAVKLIATQMAVEPNSFKVDQPLSTIGAGGDQMDIFSLIMSAEQATAKEIPDAKFEEVIGEFDNQLPERVTASKLAELISSL